MRKLIAVLIPFLLVSCIFNEEDGTPRAEKLAHPDIVLEKAEYMLAQGNGNPIMLSGERIVFYSSDHRAELESFSFYQTGDDGEIRIEGQADRGTVNTENETIRLEGNVMLKEISENLEIHADQAFIDSRNQEITAQGPVSVRSGGGNFRGTGFSGDMKTKRYSFSSIEQGELVL